MFTNFIGVKIVCLNFFKTFQRNKITNLFLVNTEYF